MGRPPTHGNEWSVGHSLGPYRIVGLLGRGGMGEVYRAHDTTLGRDVAIKILPSVFTTDADRRARFEREARVLAALNRAHIGAIYGVQETDGVRALVLELVEGDTLAAACDGGESVRGSRLNARARGITLTSRSITMRITSKGQVTIPMAIREELGLLPNTEVEFEIDRGAVRMKKAAAPRTMDRGRALIEHMRGRGTRRITTDQIMKLTRG